jgi:hypothetical protein
MKEKVQTANVMGVNKRTENSKRWSRDIESPNKAESIIATTRGHSMYPMEQTLLSSREQGQEGGDTRSNSSDVSYLLCRHNKTNISARVIILALETMFIHSSSWLNN